MASKLRLRCPDGSTCHAVTWQVNYVYVVLTARRVICGHMASKLRLRCPDGSTCHAVTWQVNYVYVVLTARRVMRSHGKLAQVSTGLTRPSQSRADLGKLATYLSDTKNEERAESHVLHFGAKNKMCRRETRPSLVVELNSLSFMFKISNGRRDICITLAPKIRRVEGKPDRH